MLHIDENLVCHVQPVGISKTCTFIIDTDDVPVDDLKADDLGVWKANGTKSTYISVLPDGSARILSGKTTSGYCLTRRYYTHATYHLFRRIIIDLKGLSLCNID